jgi:hypothetical protein
MERLKCGIEVEVDEAEVEVHGIVSFVKGYPTLTLTLYLMNTNIPKHPETQNHRDRRCLARASRLAGVQWIWGVSTIYDACACRVGWLGNGGAALA